MLPNRQTTSNWRQYQAELQKQQRKKRFRKRLPFLILLMGLGGLGAFMLFSEGAKKHAPTISIHQTENEASESNARSLSQEHLAQILDRMVPNGSFPGKQFVVENDGRLFRFVTTIQTKLQKHTERLLRHSRTLQAAVVILDPSDGRILTMAGRDTNGGNENVCLRADFPAASLFKIVSAAAALESAGFTPDRPLHFRGGRHTLYKQQLEAKKGRYSRRTSFRRAFAASNNSVFGKIGIYDLGRETIGIYANRFLFNRDIPFDLPLDISTITIPEDSYGLAEIASGFNKRTLVSPLHAALMTAAVVNRGHMTAPWVVAAVLDEADHILYKGRRTLLYSPVGHQTASHLKLLMQDTVRYGTGRTAFGKLRRMNLFKGYVFGAKTGTINDAKDRYKYDWVSAFALPPDGENRICISVLAVHGRLLGTRATELARALIHYYYATY